MLDFQRLYVSPLDTEILPIVLTGSLQASARNISLHTLQTFPEKRYGYLELPAPEAERFRKKFHGSILKGAKMRVEHSRPEKAAKMSEESKEAVTDEARMQEKVRKPDCKQENGVLPGIELPQDRRVKRGWTDPNSKTGKKGKKLAKPDSRGVVTKASTYTNGPECLFKTKAPPNATGNMPREVPEAGKPKKRKRGESERNVIIHEFERTTKHASFLRDAANSKDTKPASTYFEGKGWLDEDGNVIEPEKPTRRTRSKAPELTGSSGGTAEAQDTNIRRMEKRDSARAKEKAVKHQQQYASDDETSSSGSSSSESEEEAVSRTRKSSRRGLQGEGLANGATESEASDRRGNEVNTDQVRALSISRSSPKTPSETAKEVHPLEALFKRPYTAASHTPQKPSLEVKTAFSFFDQDVDQDDNVPVVIPQTPFTQQDFQERRLRSAAPTPDTAAPGKTTFGRVWPQDSVGPESESDEGKDDARSTPRALSDAVGKEPGGDAEESEFAKWFYEHRGETNRAWKRRRREAAKEKRQRENKRR
ncbi:MAG: hypothetical protein Q9179_006345 [Wetmoreana sp. 5 TL-2023]